MASTLSKYVNSDSGAQDSMPNFRGDNRDQRSFAFWCALWFAELWRVTREGGVLLSFIDWRQLPASTDALQAGGWVWRGVVPWNKTEATRPQLGRPRAQCEYILFASKGPHVAYPGAPAVPGFFEYPTPRERTHITEKPVGLLCALLDLFAPGALILDPFCGSGTTGSAAILRGRKALLFEIDQQIASEAAERLTAEESGISLQDARSGQLPLLAGA